MWEGVPEGGEGARWIEMLADQTLNLIKHNSLDRYNV